MVGRLAARARRDGRRARRPRPRPGRGHVGAVRRHPGRAAHEPGRQRGQPPPRRGRPGDVALAVARSARSERSRSVTSPTASTSRPGSAPRCASCSTATSVPAGWQRADDPATWAPVDAIPAAELWAARARQRAALVGFVGRRSVGDRLIRGDLRDYVDAAARAFDPEVLTIGFARRVATYKRLDLLTRDPEWTLALLGGDRPVQVVLAGKAHPATRRPSASCRACSGSRRRGSSPSASSSSTTTTSPPRRGWSAAATSG